MRIRTILYITTLLLLASCSTQKQFVVTPPSFHKGYPTYEGPAWVKNESRPFRITKGLENKHVALTASHGRYFNNKKGEWDWQRPYMNGTREDLFTSTIVVPYLIPMLQNAGAVVFTPRERDYQRHEIIVDNSSDWEDAGTGFATVSHASTTESVQRTGLRQASRTVSMLI